MVLLGNEDNEIAETVYAFQNEECLFEGISSLLLFCIK